MPAILTIIDSVSVDRARANFVPTTVTASLSEEFQGLIGMDFVANYTVSIDSRKEVVVFTENPPRPNLRGGHDEAWWRKNFKQFRAASDHWRERAESRQSRVGARSSSNDCRERATNSRSPKRQASKTTNPARSKRVHRA